MIRAGDFDPSGRGREQFGVGANGDGAGDAVVTGRDISDSKGSGGKIEIAGVPRLALMIALIWVARRHRRSALADE